MFAATCGWRAGNVVNAALSLPTTPIFVLPYKRYACQTLLHLCRSYLDNDRQSYRQTVRPSNRVIGYLTPEKQPIIDERALDHMTVWRMLTWLGIQVPALQLGLRLVVQHNPDTTCHRFVGAVDPQKFRSPQRQRQLTQARKLLHLIDQWDRTFAEKFFPRFATRVGFS